MERHLGRYFDTDKVIHHKDENIANNNIDNLEVWDRSSHAAKHSSKPDYEEKEFRCPVCKTKFILNKQQIINYNSNRKRNIKGPFCSRRCSGIASHW